jgi:uncharacterized surface protein with fasciclin (FAS1) repeats
LSRIDGFEVLIIYVELFFVQWTDLLNGIVKKIKKKKTNELFDADACSSHIKTIKMKMKFFSFAIALLMGAFVTVSAQKTVVDVAVGSKAHTTLVAAVKAAGLVETLQGAGPFTVFAPVNDAFGKLPAGTVETLLKPENKAQLTKVLTYHVVAGNLDAAAVVKAIKDGKGKAVVKTVSGGSLTASLKDGKVILTDENGGVATVTVTDLKAGNGVIHVIDGVVLPK